MTKKIIAILVFIVIISALFLTTVTQAINVNLYKKNNFEFAQTAAVPLTQ